MIQALLVKPFKEETLKQFTDIEGYQFTYAAQPTQAQLEAAEVILGQPEIPMLHAAKKLRWLQLTSAGSDKYVQNRDAFEQGATLTNLSGAFGTSISEFVLAMTLMLYKHLHLYRDHQRLHSWEDMGRQRSPVGKNLLILGAGNIGTDVARHFRPFGCKITGLWRVPREVPAEFDQMITLDGLDAALAEADIVVGALPDTVQTHRLMNRDRLGKMKKDAILINMGRGGLIDQTALAECLKEGRLYGAALDVTDPEPLPADHPLWDCENALITPHISGGSFGHLDATEEFLFSLCRDNLNRWRDGKPLLNRVDFETGYRVTEDRA